MRWPWMKFDDFLTTGSTVQVTDPVSPTSSGARDFAVGGHHNTNQEIAELLSITPGTVRVHVHSILHKFGGCMIAGKQWRLPCEQNCCFDANHCR